jgi:hypothetical protein
VNGQVSGMTEHCFWKGLQKFTLCSPATLPYYLAHESTNNAYVTGTIVPVSSDVKGMVTRLFDLKFRPMILRRGWRSPKKVLQR